MYDSTSKESKLNSANLPSFRLMDFFNNLSIRAPIPFSINAKQYRNAGLYLRWNNTDKFTGNEKVRHVV